MIVAIIITMLITSVVAIPLIVFCGWMLGSIIYVLSSILCIIIAGWLHDHYKDDIDSQIRDISRTDMMVWGFGFHFIGITLLLITLPFIRRDNNNKKQEHKEQEAETEARGKMWDARIKEKMEQEIIEIKIDKERTFLKKMKTWTSSLPIRNRWDIMDL